MKNRKRLWLVLLALVLLVGGAYLLYRQLGQSIAPTQLAVQDTPSSSAVPEVTSASAAPEETPTSAAPEEAGASTAEPSPAQTPSPDFTVYDQDGNEVHLSDYRGKPVVLNFWASWCGPCQREMPDFNDQFLELGEQVQFLMVNLTDGSRETVDTAASFIEKQGYTFPVFYDRDMDAANAYSAYSIPTTYFIDDAGRAVAQATGSIELETLQKGIALILK